MTKLLPLYKEKFNFTEGNNSVWTSYSSALQGLVDDKLDLGKGHFFLDNKLFSKQMKKII